MKIGRVTCYPWYQEIIAIIAALYSIGIFWMNWDKLPEVIATHFNSHGIPDGSMEKLSCVLFLGSMFILFWGLDAFFRYRSLVDEKTKRFYWIQLLLNPLLPLHAWAGYVIVDFNLRNPDRMDLAVPVLLGAIAASTLFLIATELLRKKHEVIGAEEPYRRKPQLSASGRFLFVEKLLPSWWVPAVIVSLLATVPAAVIMCMHPWIVLKLSGIVTGLAALALMFFAGGFRFIVHPKAVEVRLTVGNIPMKIIPIEKVQETGVQEYSALHDFGGWGIRWGQNNTTGYIMFGNEGVLIKTAERNYVVSSRYSEEVAHLISELLEKRTEVSALIPEDPYDQRP